MSFLASDTFGNPFDNPRWGLEFQTVINQTISAVENYHSPDLLMWKCEPGHLDIRYVFASPHFHFAEKNTVIFDRAASLKAIFDGALHLCTGGRHVPFTFMRLVQVRTNETFDQWEGSILASPFCPTILNSAVPRGLYPLGRFGPQMMMFLARYDDVTLNLLKHLGYNGPDFRTLYSLLDWLRKHGWKDDEKVASCSEMKGSDVRRFTATVNNVAVLGPFARHGDKGYQLPSDPISLPDAKKLILSATYQFLKDRAVAHDLDKRWNAIKDDGTRLL